VPIRISVKGTTAFFVKPPSQFNPAIQKDVVRIPSVELVTKCLMTSLL
jgi:hypothetical protein